MPRQAATIESLPMAFELVKTMQADGLEWGDGYRPLGRQALAAVIEGRMDEAVDVWLVSEIRAQGNRVRLSGMNFADEFFTCVKDSFDRLCGIDAATPNAMSVGLRRRNIGRPGRIGARARVIDDVQKHEDARVRRRLDIARHRQKHHPAKIEDARG